jgi:S-adenosylhomocysteine hydrolase
MTKSGGSHKVDDVKVPSAASMTKPTTSTSSTMASPSSSSPPTITGVLERLQTPAGQKLLDGLVTSLAPHAKSESGFLEAPELKSLPEDRFEAALVKNLFGQMIREGEVRDGTLAALADEFAACGDTQGRVDLAAVQRSLGAKGVQFLQALSAIDKKSGDPLADRRAFAPLSERVATKVASTSSIAPPMSALTTMMKQVARKDELKGFSFMGLQHLFASSATLFDAVHDLGVKNDDMRLLGKVYSTNHRVVAELESRGAHVHGKSKKVGAKEFAAAMEEGIEEQLRGIIEGLPRPASYVDGKPVFADQPKPQVMLIDDGAEAIKILHEKFPEYAPFFVCVEQTRRGARILHELQQKGELRCPVANVAETWAKLEWESPMTGHSVVLEVDRKLDRLAKFGVKPPHESLVLGCGAVGGGVARAMLRRGLEVHLYDKDPQRTAALRDALLAEGHDASKVHAHDDKARALAHAGVLVSCVGMRTLDVTDHDLLPDGAILVNAASADDELGPQDLLPFRKGDVELDARGNLWSVFQGKAINTGKADAEAHSDGVVHHPCGKEFLVVNNGYVVNMTGERDPIPPRYIQLTRTLLLLGGLTAKRAAEGKDGGVGIHDVPREWQEALVHLVQRELKKTGEDLRTPSWDTKAADQPPPEEELMPPPDIVAAALAEAEKRPLPKTQRDLQVAEQVERALKNPGDGDHGSGFVDVAAAQAAQKGIDVVAGYRIGKAIEGSREWLIARQMGTGTTLTLEGAALHAASVAVAAVTGAQLRVSLVAPGQQTVSPFTEKSRVEHVGAKTIAGGDDGDHAARFAELWGHNVRVLTASVLAGRLKRPPTTDEVAARLRQALSSSSSVDARPYLAALARSADADDRALFAALSAALQRSS